MSESAESHQIYRNFHTIYVLLDDGDKRTLKQAGLTPSQFNFLRTLDRAESDSLTASEVADGLLCTRGNVTRLVKRLQKQSLVRVGSDDHDQRLVRIFLTPEGEARLQKARTLVQTAVNRRLQALTPEQRRQLNTLTDTIINLLEADLISESS